MDIQRFDDLLTHLARHPRRCRAAVVWAADPTTREAVSRAIEAGIIEACFVGCRPAIEADVSLQACRQHLTVVDAADAIDAAAKAVALAAADHADIIIKGMINTDDLLRAVLNKQTGILPEGEVLTHVTVAEIPAYDKLLAFSDAAVIPYPDAHQREAQLRYVLQTVRGLCVDTPRVVMVHCSEKADTRHFPFMQSYLDIIDKSRAGAYGSCIVDGPLDVKTALSKAALDKKGLVSPVDGHADALIFPDIVAANAFYKTLTLFGGARIAGIICGAKVPVVLPSRGDSAESKTLSIMLAASFAK